MKFIQYSGSTILFIGHVHDQKGNSHFCAQLFKKSALHSSIMLWFVAVAKN